MAIPVSERKSKNTLHLSLPEELVRQVREVAYRKRPAHVAPVPGIHRGRSPEAVAEDEVAADAVASVSSPT